jgi:hypothetical protein
VRLGLSPAQVPQPQAASDSGAAQVAPSQVQADTHTCRVKGTVLQPQVTSVSGAVHVAPSQVQADTHTCRVKGTDHSLRQPVIVAQHR